MGTFCADATPALRAVVTIAANTPTALRMNLEKRIVLFMAMFTAESMTDITLSMSGAGLQDDRVVGAGHEQSDGCHGQDACRRVRGIA